MRKYSLDEARQAHRSDGAGAVHALLTGGDPRSLRNATAVVEAASRNPARLAELVQCVFSTDEIIRMRASDALEKVCRYDPGLVQPFVPRLLGEMSRIEQPSVQWHLAQILTEVRLEEAEQAQAITILVTSTVPATGSSPTSRSRP